MNNIKQKYLYFTNQAHSGLGFFRKILDVSSDLIKVLHLKLKKLKQVLPFIGLCLGLIDLILKSINISSSKTKDLKLKAIYLSISFISIALIVSMLYSPISLPLKFVSFILIGAINSIIELFEGVYSYISSINNNLKLVTRYKENKIILNDKRSNLIEMISSLIKNENQSSQLLEKQEILYWIDKRIKYIDETLLQAEKNRVIKKDILFNLVSNYFITLGSSIIAITSTLLPPILLSLSFYLMSAALAFDVLSLAYKIKANFYSCDILPVTVDNELEPIEINSHSDYINICQIFKHSNSKKVALTLTKNVSSNSLYDLKKDNSMDFELKPTSIY